MSIFDRFTMWPWRAKDSSITRENRGGISESLRETQALGPWTETFGQWQPRTRDPWLLEALREAIPILDGGIGRLTTMDGILEVEGDNDALVQEIEEWMRNIPVNDLETGYQAFYTSHSAEHYEQGIGVGEFIYEKKGRDVVGIRVADSKGLQFFRDDGALRLFYRAPKQKADQRQDGLTQVENILRGQAGSGATAVMASYGYVELDMPQLVFALHKPEADNPYGTSVLRSMPFVAQVLIKMENASGRAWTRFGDPAFHVHYSTKNRKVDASTALKRANEISGELGRALAVKERGNSGDLVTAAAADDDVVVKIIGHEGQVLEIEQPARHMLEQIVAGFGLPPWMLGITWSQAAGIGEQQSVVVLQESQTRFAVRKPQLRRPIEAMLRARGRTWKPGDWDLVQRLPNLMDEAKRAQAAFLRAQTSLMLNERGQVEPPDTGRGIDNNLRAPRTHTHGKARKAADDDDSEGHAEQWAEDDPELPKLEASTTAAMLAAWWLLRDRVLGLLGLNSPSDADFAFEPSLLADLLSGGQSTTTAVARELLVGQTGAWERGLANAAIEVSADFDDAAVREAIARLRGGVRQAFAAEGLRLVRSGVARQYRQPIVAALASGEFDGQNPVNVAAELRRRFGNGQYNWERLATTEIAMAQSAGKRDLMRAQGVELYDLDTAPGACRICLDIEAAGPYRVEDPKSPLPGYDTHPECRCTIRPVQ